jgi:hypothetical protein
VRPPRPMGGTLLRACDLARWANINVGLRAPGAARRDQRLVAQKRHACPSAQDPEEPLPADPAMSAGVDDHVWTLTKVAALLD